MDISLQSAPFKKDYLASLSIFLLTAVILSEIVLIIWMPFLFRSETYWQRQVALQQMTRTLDDLRNQYGKLKPVNNRQDGEITLVRNCLDDLARYLRRYGENLDRNQVESIQKVLLDFKQSYEYFNQGNTYSRELELNPTAAFKQVYSSVSSGSSGLRPPAASQGKK